MSEVSIERVAARSEVDLDHDEPVDEEPAPLSDQDMLAVDPGPEPAGPG